MKKALQFSLLVFLFSTAALLAQNNVGMGTATPNPAAALDITSTSKGLLPPRLSYAERQSIAAPVPAGLMVYCTNCGANGEMQVYNGVTWTNMIGGLAAPGFALLNTTSATSITRTSAITGGEVTDDGGSAVTAIGVCWSTAPNPTTANDFTIDGSGAGAFTSSLNNLNRNTTYYYRAYATNANGTSYGSEQSFRTILVIGDTYEGGIIFYLDGNGGGKVCSPTEVIKQWTVPAYQSTVVPSGAQSATDGQANTAAIVAQAGPGDYAAYYCDTLSLSGHNDWYLPSQNELILIRTNIGPSGINVGNFTLDNHWSSTEVNFEEAFRVRFVIPPKQGTNRKFAAIFVRAIRVF